MDSAFRDFTREFGDIIETIFNPLLFFLAQFEQLLLATPWPVFLLGAGALAWIGSRSLKVTVGVMLGFFAIGFLDMWTPMISTVTMIATATLLCLAIGIPLGIWMSRSDRVQSLITPILDIMQTIPSFVYIFYFILYFFVLYFDFSHLFFFSFLFVVFKYLFSFSLVYVDF